MVRFQILNYWLDPTLNVKIVINNLFAEIGWISIKIWNWNADSNSILAIDLLSFRIGVLKSVSVVLGKDICLKSEELFWTQVNW